MHNNQNRLKVGLTTGDPNGVGCELILKIFQNSQMFDLCTPIVFGSKQLLDYYIQQLQIKIPIQRLHPSEKVALGKLNLQSITNESINIKPGETSTKAGTYAIHSLTEAVKELKKGDIDVLVTSPIDKKVCYSDTFPFAGHTAYLEKNIKGDSLMFMVSDKLRIALLTEHIPIGEVIQQLSPKHISAKVELVHRSLIQDFGIIKPKIAILGINPHAGDQGLIGSEDEQLLKPVIRELFDKGMLVFGPYAADGFFGAQTYKQFDAVVAPYHDQGLVAFKAMSFGQGVNYTAGLSHIRTSPDHGTAFDIAGKGIADESSFRAAIYTAIDIYRQRASIKA